MVDISESAVEELRARLKPLIREIRVGRRMNLRQIAFAIGYQHRLPAFYKWARNDNAFPGDFALQNVVDRLTNLLANPVAAAKAEQRSSGANIETRVTQLVSIFLDEGKACETYTGDERVCGMIIRFNGSKALLAYLNTATINGNAEGWVPVLDAAVEPRLKYGSLIGIRKIHKGDFRPGYLYLIVDSSEQLFIRKILPSAFEDAVILISENESSYPRFVLPVSKILALFRIEKAIIDP